MLKFELTANANTQEGFKLKVQSDSPEELKTVNDLTTQLIGKISVIEIKISESNNEY